MIRCRTYTRSVLRRTLLSIAASLWLATVAFADTPARIAVLDFELNDLTLDPGNAAEIERTASIKPLLVKALNEAHHATVAVDSAAQSSADRGVGYLFDHPDAAAALGRAVGARWVVVGRVHKASFLFVYFMAHVVDVETGEQIASLVVEVKGPQKALTGRGAQSLAQQIATAVDKPAS
jgi:uncharacterized protein DUF2380